jgi:hypothetical protein
MFLLTLAGAINNLFFALGSAALLFSLFVFAIWKYEGYKQNKDK